MEDAQHGARNPAGTRGTFLSPFLPSPSYLVIKSDSE